MYMQHRSLKTGGDDFYGQMAALANDGVESDEVSSNAVMTWSILLSIYPLFYILLTQYL